MIDDHTRFLMRFNGNFKVEGNPTPSGDLFIANNGNLITDGSIQCVQYNKTDPFLYIKCRKTHRSLACGM